MEELPEIIPVFPLTGALLLPGGRLPLHIFEERYRNMVEDALEGDRAIGIIQPFGKAPQTYSEDTSDDSEDAEEEDPELYDVGCVGLIERWERLPDGRYIMLLRGVRRFTISEELPQERGYRRVAASFEAFAVDSDDVEADVVPDQLMGALRQFAEAHKVPLELDRLEELSGLALLNSIAMALPFPPAEKQALLEAPDVNQRHELLLTLLDMGIELRGDVAQPMLN
ncbi:MAG: LON peptidase substrate-binding domain-containing protein [Acidobacteriota bacterium]